MAIKSMGNISVSGGTTKTLGPERYECKKGQKKVNVTVYTLPKGKTGKLCSFSYSTPSPKTKKLQNDTLRLKKKICELEKMKDKDLAKEKMTKDEKNRKVALLKNKLKYLTKQLTAEIAATPINSVIIREEE